MHTETTVESIVLEYGSYSVIASMMNTSPGRVREIVTGDRPANTPRAKMILEVAKQTAAQQKEIRARIAKLIGEQEP